MQIKNEIDFRWGNLSDARLIRRKVFIEEQHVSPEEEIIDEEDERSHHLVAYVGDKPVGTGRIIPIGDEFYLGRIAVLNECRKLGIGKGLVSELLIRVKDMGIAQIYIHSQVHAKDFYKLFGFVEFGEPFFEAGILHVYMLKNMIK